jgi:hypothetical protein
MYSSLYLHVSCTYNFDLLLCGPKVPWGAHNGLVKLVRTRPFACGLIWSQDASFIQGPHHATVCVSERLRSHLYVEHVWGLVYMYACMHVCISVCMYVCMHIHMYVCMHIRMYVCMSVCMYGDIRLPWSLNAYLYVRMQKCMYVHSWMHVCTHGHSLYVCMYVLQVSEGLYHLYNMYMSIHTYIHYIYIYVCIYSIRTSMPACMYVCRHCSVWCMSRDCNPCAWIYYLRYVGVWYRLTHMRTCTLTRKQHVLIWSSAMYTRGSARACASNSSWTRACAYFSIENVYANFDTVMVTVDLFPTPPFGYTTWRLSNL